LKPAGLVDPELKNKPRTSYIRFQADQPHETWQSDFTNCRLADGIDVITVVRDCTEEDGVPASTLTDNGMIHTVRFATGRSGSGCGR
jgi:hypothetical protein